MILILKILYQDGVDAKINNHVKFHDIAALKNRSTH